MTATITAAAPGLGWPTDDPSSDAAAGLGWPGRVQPSDTTARTDPSHTTDPIAEEHA